MNTPPATKVSTEPNSPMPNIQIDDPLITFTKQQPQDPPPQPEPEPELQDADIKELSDAAMKALGFESEEKTETPEPPPEPKPEDPPQDPPPSEPKEPKPEEKPKVEDAPKPDDINKKFDEFKAEVSDRLEKLKPTPKTEPAPQPEQPNEKDLQTRAVLEILQEDPKYAGLVQKFDAFVAREKDYKTAWEKKNPGQVFNPSDSEHASFYDANEPTFAAEDFEKAEKRYQVRSEAERLWQERESRRLHEEAKTQVEKRTVDFTETTVKSVLKNVNEAAASKYNGNLDALAEEDPFLPQVMKQVNDGVLTEVGELTKLLTPALGYRFNPQNPLHQHLGHCVLEYEKAMAGKPDNEKILNGKRFATFEQYDQLPPEQRGRYWTFTDAPEKAVSFLVDDWTHLAKTRLGKMHESAKHWAEKSGMSASQVTPPPQPQPAATPAKPAPPNLSSGGDKVPPKGTDTKGSDNFSDVIDKALFG